MGLPGVWISCSEDFCGVDTDECSPYEAAHKEPKTMFKKKIRIENEEKTQVLIQTVNFF